MEYCKNVFPGDCTLLVQQLQDNIATEQNPYENESHPFK